MSLSSVNMGEQSSLSSMIPRFPRNKNEFPIYKQRMLLLLTSLGLVKLLHEPTTESLVQAVPVVKIEKQSLPEKNDASSSSSTSPSSGSAKEVKTTLTS